ncbi:MAG: cell division protein SepF [Clostridia bacterium]|nr:cell division protein SepF [Clostridia bacterium]
MKFFDKFKKNKYEEWDDEEEEYEDEEENEASVSIEGNLDLKVVSPKSLEQLLSAVDYLSMGSTVLLNLEGVERELYKRMIDFISGAAYALEASIKKATQDSFFLAPKDVDISGEIFDTTHDDEIFSDL